MLRARGGLEALGGIGLVHHDVALPPLTDNVDTDIGGTSGQLDERPGCMLDFFANHTRIRTCLCSLAMMDLVFGRAVAEYSRALLMC